MSVIPTIDWTYTVAKIRHRAAMVDPVEYPISFRMRREDHEAMLTLQRSGLYLSKSHFMDVAVRQLLSFHRDQLNAARQSEAEAA